MSAQYRIVHFAPDPLSGARFPIAAVVETGSERKLALALHVPGPRCLGGQRPAALLTMVLEDLGRTGDLSQLPQSAGPYVVMGSPQRIPADVHEAHDWVQRHVLPRREDESEDLPERNYAPRRDVVGNKFFETWRVNHLVKRKYSPGFIDTNVDRAVHDVAHYVQGSKELLLMEPIVGSRPKLDEDLLDVSQEFLAWKQLLGRHSASSLPKPVFIAYVFGTPSVYEEARGRLTQSADQVIYADHEVQRIDFLAHIRTVGATAPEGGQTPLFQ